MRNKRKVLAAASAAASAALSVALSGCGTAGAGLPAVSADTSVEMITAGQDNSFYLTMECGAAERHASWASPSPSPARRRTPRRTSSRWCKG